MSSGKDSAGFLDTTERAIGPNPGYAFHELAPLLASFPALIPEKEKRATLGVKLWISGDILTQCCPVKYVHLFQVTFSQLVAIVS